jgi:ComF family protein
MLTPSPSARSIAAILLDRVFPRFCLGCGRRIDGGRAPLLLCPRCRGQLVRVDPRRSCRTCARPLADGRLAAPQCLDCRLAPPPFAHLHAVWRYRPPLDRVLWALKFGRLDFLAAALVAEALGGAAGELARPAGCVPVPLAPWRRLERGFNQAERLATALARHLEAPAVACLTRSGWWATPQRRLGGRARRANRELRFVARGRRPAESAAPLLLVDDVFTTGATLRAAGAALAAGRRGPVHGWVVAATPAETGTNRP